MNSEDRAWERDISLREDYSTEELEMELERRKKVGSKPVIVDNPDLRPLMDICQSIIDNIASGDYYEDNDDRQYVYETAMTVLFGKDIFEWINKNI